jgi:hypothetical protein
MAHNLLPLIPKGDNNKLKGGNMKIRITYKISNNVIGEKNLEIKKFMDLIRILYFNNNLISYFIINQENERK